MKVDELLWSHCQELCRGPKEPPSGSPIPKTFLGDIGVIKVYLVDGDKAKLEWDIDFVEGANGMEAIGRGKPKGGPAKNEIWIDDNLQPHEWKFICMHEAHEWRDMRQGMTYEKAHERANKQEMVFRRRYYDADAGSGPAPP